MVQRRRQMTVSSPRAAPSAGRSKVVADQAVALVLGVALLGGSALLRRALEKRRASPDANGVQLVREDPESEKTLSSLAVTFPRLTLGGLRGIASTALWMQAEEDKNNRQWIDLETKYDLIGALQPYFSSVYIYHSWNQAYNLSAQWQEQDIKYKWVLDGIAYLYKGEDFNPASPDIMYEEAQLYAMKLGLSFERTSYRAHWRSDLSRLHELNGKPESRDDATVALQHVRAFVTRRDPRDPPAARSYFHTEELPDPAHPGATTPTGWGLRIYPDIDPAKGFNLFADRKDDKRPNEPMDFRYGVSPFYFAYIEYQRCLALPTVPTYTGLKVIDAWPAMSLRLWCRDDLYYTGDTMRQLFGPTPDQALLASPTAFSDKVQEIRDCYRNIQLIAPRAIDLFFDHIQRIPENRSVHTPHMFETRACQEISKAEIKLFDTLVLWQNNGRRLDDAAGAIRRGLMEADALYKAAYPVTMQWVDNVYPLTEGQPANPDRADFERYANELQARSRGIEALLTLPAGQDPDMSFLGPEHDVVER
jgi:hypothetical protein